VYKCKDKADGTEYAVKVSEKYNSLAVEEVRKHEALSEHPNCVKFYKAWEEG
jgi:membrane-associated tyrosine/threonine-specific cdc2-inhibitory kinase